MDTALVLFVKGYFFPQNIALDCSVYESNQTKNNLSEG